MRQLSDVDGRGLPVEHAPDSTAGSAMSNAAIARGSRCPRTALRLHLPLAALLLVASVALPGCTASRNQNPSLATEAPAEAMPSAAIQPPGVGEASETARDITWEGWFGSNHANPGAGYTLLAQGFFRDDASSALSAYVADWIDAHPDASVVRVADFGEAPDGSWTFWVWLSDGSSNLAHELVRRGLSTSENLSAAQGMPLLVSSKVYQEYEVELLDLENQAKRERLGVWK